MTIIIAQRRGDDILLLADTKIGNAGEKGPNVIPGRLKLIVLGKGLTVGFAGNADAADVTIRKRTKPCWKLVTERRSVFCRQHLPRAKPTTLLPCTNHKQVSCVSAREGFSMCQISALLVI
ncbi:hypothetical protein N185_16325 [Sinorhizobium sp. GW3]|nr:hypothetical protein N185_16325 [Sinorhizobium sp. GW3]